MGKKWYLLAVRSIIIPHQIDHPQPTKQKISVNACATPTIQLTKNEPMRARAPSCCENLGMPRHKQNNPENIVPACGNERTERKRTLSWVSCVREMKCNKHVNDNYVPEPGIKQLQIKQNHAKPVGRTGMAAFMIDVWSTSDSSSFGRVSSGGSVGAMLCFLLFILVRRLSTTGFFLQHINISHKRAQQPLEIPGERCQPKTNVAKRKKNQTKTKREVERYK